MNKYLFQMFVGLSLFALFTSCKLEVEPTEMGLRNSESLSLADTSKIQQVDNRKNLPDEEDESKKKKKKPKKNTEVTEVLDFNTNHTYEIDVSGLITDQQEHIPYEDFKNPKNIGNLFREIMSKSISHENSKRLDPFVEKLVKISKYYAKNQADLLYFLNSFVESLGKESLKKRDNSEDFYHPYQYVHYGVKSDFENITLISTILYDTCHRPKVAIIDLDVNKSRISIDFFHKQYDYNQIFQNDQPRMENFAKLVMRASRCMVDVSELIQKTNELKLSIDEVKNLNVESKLSNDGQLLQITVNPTELESLTEYYKESILLIDSVDMKFSVKAIKDNSPAGFVYDGRDLIPFSK